VRALAASPYLARLKVLSLSGTNLSAAAATALAQSPHLSQLTLFELFNTRIEEQGAAEARQALRERYRGRVDWNG
jgi:hypothetical protein